MHISDAQDTTVRLLELVRVLTYVRRLDLSRGALHVATLCVERGLLRVEGVAQATVIRRLAALVGEQASATAWVAAMIRVADCADEANTFTSVTSNSFCGPTDWDQAEVEAGAGVHVRVRVVA